MTSTTKKWTILGNGAIGHLLACRFAQNKIPAILLSRTQLPSEKYEVIYHDDEEVRKYILHGQPVADCRAVDYLILAVKAHQVETAINDIRAALKPTSKIFLLQNGMGTLEKVTELLSDIINPRQIYPGTNTHGVYLSKKATGMLDVVHAGIGNIVIGGNYLVTEKNSQANSIHDLKELGLGVSWVEDIEQRLWIKLAINAAINPLTAIQNCLNGELLLTNNLKQQVETLCNESSDLFKKIGLKIHQEQLIDDVFDVIVKTADNQSSMLQDVASGKKTEIEAITGYLLKISRKMNVPMPEHNKLYQSIISL
jgi:2-dehydropantoate 2-reductase